MLWVWCTGISSQGISCEWPGHLCNGRTGGIVCALTNLNIGGTSSATQAAYPVHGSSIQPLAPTRYCKQSVDEFVLSPACRLCEHSRRIKLIDLGAACDLRSGTNYLPTETISDPCYCPPEEVSINTV